MLRGCSVCSWALPLLMIVLYVAHWGTVTAYLPARAEDAGANVGLFFAADGSEWSTGAVLDVNGASYLRT